MNLRLPGLVRRKKEAGGLKVLLHLPGLNHRKYLIRLKLLWELFKLLLNLKHILIWKLLNLLGMILQVLLLLNLHLKRKLWFRNLSKVLSLIHLTWRKCKKWTRNTFKVSLSLRTTKLMRSKSSSWLILLTFQFSLFRINTKRRQDICIRENKNLNLLRN